MSDERKVLDSEDGLKREKEGVISRRVAAGEIVLWLKKAEIVGIVGILAPFLTAVFVTLDGRFGLVIPLFSAIFGAFFYQMFKQERKRLIVEYDLSGG